MLSYLTPSAFCYGAASVLLFISAPAHALMGRNFIRPGLQPLRGSNAAVAAESNWMVQSAYHLVACILAHRWSQTPSSAWTRYDDAMLALIVGMNWVGCTVYARIGDKRTTGMLFLRGTLLALGRTLQFFS